MKEKPKILFVDDEVINRMIASRSLGSQYEVIAAEEGPKALEILQADPAIQLVITDMNMPGMTGLELIQEAHKQSSNRRYFILSGYAITKEIQEAINSNLVADYFEKPADFERIHEALEKAG